MNNMRKTIRLFGHTITINPMTKGACIFCDKQFWQKVYNQKYCSKKCQSRHYYVKYDGAKSQRQSRARKKLQQ